MNTIDILRCRAAFRRERGSTRYVAQLSDDAKAYVVWLIEQSADAPDEDAIERALNSKIDDLTDLIADIDRDVVLR